MDAREHSERVNDITIGVFLGLWLFVLSVVILGLIALAVVGYVAHHQ